MPTHKSAAKRIKTAERARQRNRKISTSLKSAVKTLKTTKGADNKTAAFKATTSLLDKAARRGVIHKNKASRTKSRLARLLKQK